MGVFPNENAAEPLSRDSQQQEKCSNHTYLYKTTKHVISTEGRSGEMACSE